MRLHPDFIASLRARQQKATPPTLEEVLTSPRWFGLETASPLQRAVCRWAEGLPVDHDKLAAELRALSQGYAPDIAERMQLDWILGGPNVRVTERPELMVLDGGIRSGKSMLAAAAAATRALSVPIKKNIATHEVIRDSTVSVDKDKAGAVLMHLRGLFDRNPELAAAKTREVAEGIDMVRSDTGHTIELRVVHGGTAGKGLVSYWHLGATFDEAARMLGEDEAKVNLDDMMDAVEHRVLPGGQIWWISSPTAPLGPFYDIVTNYLGKPGRILVVRFPGPAFNHVTWTPEECERARERKRRGERDDKRGSFDTDVMAEWGTPESMMFDPSLLAHARPGDLAADPLCTYYAAMDPATRGNAWTVEVGARVRQADGSTLPTHVASWEWTPQGAPLDPRVVMIEIAEKLAPYEVDHVITDQLAADFVISLGRQVGLEMVAVPWTAANKLNDFDSLRQRLRTRGVELHAAAVEDLKQVRRRLTVKGAQIVLPVTANGRHCDHAPALAALFSGCETWEEPRVAVPEPGDVGYNEWCLEEQERAYKERLRERVRRANRGPDEQYQYYDDDDPWLGVIEGEAT